MKTSRWTAGRAAAAAIAALVWLALVLQAPITIAGVRAEGGDLLAGLWRYFGFFTILTNAFVAVVMTRRAMGGRPSASLVSAATLAILFVGFVYHLLLARQWTDLTPLQWGVDRLLHYVAPAATFAYWLAFVPKTALTWRDPLLWLIFPMAYLAYALARGAVDGWYPYGFIDAGQRGYLAVAQTALGFAAALLLSGLAAVALSKAWARITNA